MFGNDLFYALVAFILALIINRLLAENAMRRLSAEQKIELIDSFSAHRTYSLIVLAILLIAYLAAMQVMPRSSSFALSLVFFAAVTITQVLNTGVSYRKLRRLNPPKEYLNNFFLRCVIYYCGLAVLIFVLTFRYINR